MVSKNNTNDLLKVFFPNFKNVIFKNFFLTCYTHRHT